MRSPVLKNKCKQIRGLGNDVYTQTNKPVLFWFPQQHPWRFAALLFLCHICGSAYCFHENCLAAECVSPLLWTIADVYVDYPEIPKSV